MGAFATIALMNWMTKHATVVPRWLRDMTLHYVGPIVVGACKVVEELKPTGVCRWNRAMGSPWSRVGGRCALPGPREGEPSERCPD